MAFKCAKYSWVQIGLFILCVINVAIGLILTVFGGLMTFSREASFSFVSTQVKQLSEHIQPMKEYEVEVGQLLLKLTKHFCLVLFIAGFILLVLGIFGIIAVIIDNVTLWIIFLACVVAVIIAHIALLIYYFVRKDVPRKYFNEYIYELVQNYTSLRSGDASSILLSVIMIEGKCCGYINGNDFNQAILGRTDIYDKEMFTRLPYPITCCRIGEDYERLFDSCPYDYTDETSTVYTGCKNYFIDKGMNALDLTAFLSLIVLLINIILMILVVFWIYPVHSEKQYYDMVSKAKPITVRNERSISLDRRQ